MGPLGIHGYCARCYRLLPLLRALVRQSALRADGLLPTVRPLRPHAGHDCGPVLPDAMLRYPRRKSADRTAPVGLVAQVLRFPPGISR